MASDRHIAVRRNARARAAIALKFKVLRSWARHGVPWQTHQSGGLVRDSDGEQLLVAYPRDIKSFAEWKGPVPLNDGKQETMLVLLEVARSTLNQPSYESTRHAVGALMGLVHTKALRQLESTNKGTLIEGLRTELAYSNRVLDQQELDVVQLRREADAARIAFGEEHALRLRNEEELQMRIAELEAKVAELTAAMSTVSSLKPAGTR